MLKFAIDANEANVKNRVGSNVYAYQLLCELYQLSAKRSDLDFTILLSTPKQADFPPTRKNWRYVLVRPSKFWTQWALPIHLFLHRQDYDFFFTPGHYAARFSAVPYMSSVMDLAYLHFPEQFQGRDLIQLKHWTAYSVANARKILTISDFSKSEIIKFYRRSAKDILVAYPDAQLTEAADQTTIRKYFKENLINQPYFLYLGTLQPRKNLLTLIEAFESMQRQLAALNLDRRQHKRATLSPPILVIAGKLGWLTDAIVERAKSSAFADQIRLLGFVDEKLKEPLYRHAAASFLLSYYEGFGIPPLESMRAGCLPVVSNTSSLPEVVGKVGFKVSPKNPKQIAQVMLEILQMSKKEQLRQKRLMQKQCLNFSWHHSAQLLLAELEALAQENKKHS